MHQLVNSWKAHFYKIGPREQFTADVTILHKGTNSIALPSFMLRRILGRILRRFPEFGVTPLIAHISLISGPIIKQFDSMKVKIG